MRQTPIQRWYRPREIARLGLITTGKASTTERGNYAFVLRLIQTERLKAKNYSTTKRPYYLVSEREIGHYHETTNRIRKRQPTK